MKKFELPLWLPLALLFAVGLFGFVIPSWTDAIVRLGKLGLSESWAGFAGAIFGAMATLLAGGAALFAAYKTLVPMRDQLSQLVRQNDHSLYEGVRKRAAELSFEREAIERMHATSGVVEMVLRASESNVDAKVISRIETVIKEIEANVDGVRKMAAAIWGAPQVQSDRNAFVDQSLRMSDSLGALFFEIKTVKKITPELFAKHVRAWQQDRANLVQLRNKLHIHVERELERVGRVVSELEDYLFKK